MANYSVTGNKINFKKPMLIEGNLPDEPQDDALDPVAQYREEQMRQLDGQGAAPSGKPDLANPHPESMAGLKAANGGQIPQHLQPKKTGGYVPENFDYNKSYPIDDNGPVESDQKYGLHLQERKRPTEQDYDFRGPLSQYMMAEKGFKDHSGAASGDMAPFAGAGADKYDAYLRSKNPPSGAASRPELPDAGTASTTYDENDSDVMPWAGNPQMRIPSNIGSGSDEMTAEGDPSKRIASNMFRGPPRSAMMPGVTPVEPDTKSSDLAVNPGFTPYYESETGKGVKEEGRQRLQEYLQKLAGRGKQHEERLAHDNDAAGAKARNDFGALLMDSASMMGTLGGKRADTTQLAKFPGKLYQADMAPSRSAMMYENNEDKDFKSLADIGDRQERNDILRDKLRKGLAAKRTNIPGWMRPEKDGKPAGILSRDEYGNVIGEDVPSGYAPIEKPGQDNLSPYPDVYDKDGKPLPTMRNRKGDLTPAQLPPGAKYDPHPVKPRQPPDYSAKLAEVSSRTSNMTSNLNNIRDMISSKGTFEAFGPHNAKLDGALYDLAVDYAKLVDPATAAREGEVASAKKYLLPIREANGMGMSNATAIALIDEFQKKIDNRQKFIIESFNQHKAGYSGGADRDRDNTLRGYGLLDDGAQSPAPTSQGPSAEETRRAKIEKLKRLDAESGGQR